MVDAFPMLFSEGSMNFMVFFSGLFQAVIPLSPFVKMPTVACALTVLSGVRAISIINGRFS